MLSDCSSAALERASSPGVACRMDRRALPRTMMGYVVRSSGRHQIAPRRPVGRRVRPEQRSPRTAAPGRQRRHQERRHRNHLLARRRLCRRRPARAGPQDGAERLSQLGERGRRAHAAQDPGGRRGHRALRGRRDRHAHRHGGGRSRADRRLRRHGDLRAAAAGRHPGERDRLHGVARAVDVAAERRLPAAAGAVRAADAAGDQPPRRGPHQDPAPGQRRHRRDRHARRSSESSGCSSSTWASTS